IYVTNSTLATTHPKNKHLVGASLLATILVQTFLYHSTNACAITPTKTARIARAVLAVLVKLQIIRRPSH
ncbi:hypothetical protein, partial [Dokdonella sp.]|uniref:hypothetical protein n=1 Tax=Dokdonella sp. TaxID=2291710 RepID=UPI003783CCE8